MKFVRLYSGAHLLKYPNCLDFSISFGLSRIRSTDIVWMDFKKSATSPPLPAVGYTKNIYIHFVNLPCRQYNNTRGLNNGVAPHFQVKVNTPLITSFKFLHPTICNSSSKSRPVNNFSADFGMIHLLYPNLETVTTLLSILGTCTKISGP